MPRTHLPALTAPRVQGLHGDTAPAALQRYTPFALAAANAHTLNILDDIGDLWGLGVTAQDTADFLARADGADVTVNINSPGGDLFEGIAIYNLLRQYAGGVSVNIIGLAASAASVIAMAGDSVHIAPSGVLMIHNSIMWTSGNRHDHARTAEQMQVFDEAMCAVYHARTGIAKNEIAVMMDNETFINADKAVDLGFCDALTDDLPRTDEAAPEVAAAHRLDVLLAKQGLPRSERRKLLKAVKGTPRAAAPATPRADGQLLNEIRRLKQDIQAF